MDNLFQSLQSESIAIGERNDCAVKAVAVVCNKPYLVVHDQFSKLGRKKRGSSEDWMVLRSLEHFGYTPRMCREVRDVLGIKTVKTFQNFLTDNLSRIPLLGRPMLIRTREHIAAARGGIVHDWTKDRKKHIRYILGIVPKVVDAADDVCYNERSEVK